jgi:hypothetical protein
MKINTLTPFHRRINTLTSQNDIKEKSTLSTSRSVESFCLDIPSPGISNIEELQLVTIIYSFLSKPYVVAYIHTNF